MGKIIDLSVFKKQTMALKLPDGEVLQIRKPTKAMVIQVLKFKDINADSKAEEIIAAMDELTLDILNSNEKAKVYTEEDLEQMLNIDMKLVIIQAYAEFIQGLQNAPN